MASLLIVSGPPGAGKSSLSAAIAGRMSPSVLVEGDRFFGFLASGAIEPWLPESATQNEIVTEAAAAATTRFARSYDTVYDGVVGPWLLPLFARATGLDHLDYVVLLPSFDTCLARVRSRTGHGFTDEPATRKMHAEFAGADIAARHIVAADTTDLHELTETVSAARSEGTFRYRPEPAEHPR
jgi:cytidylate kinase